MQERRLNMKRCPYFEQESNTMGKPSTLFCLHPRGVGTSAIESLTSYITRLAQAHCLKTGDLFSKVLFPYLNKVYTNQIIMEGGNGFYDWAHSINGLTSMAAEFVDMLGNLTGNKELRNLTLLRYQHVMPNRGLLKRSKSWCPKCYQEMMDNGVELYEPLVWLIQSVNVCSKHRVPLKNECEHCKKTQLILERRSTPGYCVHCYSWLGEPLELQEEIDEWELTKSINVEQLIFSVSCLPEREAIKNTLITLVGAYSNFNLTHFSRKIGVPKSTFWGWYRGNNLPTLDDVIRICNSCGITIVEFYSGTLNLENNSVILSRRRKPENHSLTLVPLQELRMRVRLIVQDKKFESLSVEKMAKKLKCNKKTLYKYCGELCKMQSAIHKSFKRKNRVRRRLFLNERVKGAYFQVLNEGYVPSVRRIEEVIKRPAIFKEEAIRKNYYTLKKKHLINPSSDAIY